MQHIYGLFVLCYVCVASAVRQTREPEPSVWAGEYKATRKEWEGTNLEGGWAGQILQF